MNNIYKVIWSKAKNCYVVASEIARSHTKSATGSEKIGGVTRRSLLASLMALSLLCGGLGVASAEVDVKVDVSSAPGAVEVYTKTGVDTLLADYGKKEDVQTNKDDITALQNTTTTQGNQITANTTQIANNTADIEKKIDKEIAEAKLALKANVTDVYSKTDADARYATRTELDAKADATALDGKADITYVDQKFKEAGNNVDAKLLNYATTTEVDGKIADEVNARNNAITNAIGLERNDRDAAIDNAINGEVNARNQAINTAIGLEATKRDAAIANAKTELEGKITAEQTARKEADVELSGKINEEKTARTTKDAELDGKINDEKAVREAEDTNLSNRIGKVAENGNYIKDSDTNSVSKNLRVLDAQAKINADAIAAETVARAAKDTELEGEITKNSQDITNLQGDVTTAQGDITDLQKKDTELEGRIKTNKNAISDINKRTAGIQRIDATKETTIEGNVTVNSLGNVTAKGKLTGEGVDAGDGAITTTGAVNAGSLKVENASNLKGDVTMGKTLKVTGDTSLKKTDVDGALTVTGETTLSGELKAEKDATFEKNVTVEGTTNLKDTTVKGDLNVTGTITTKKMVFGDKAHNNYTEIDQGKVTSKNSVVNGEGQLITSSSIFNAEENKVGFANNATGDQSFHKQTSDIIMDNVKDGDNSNNRTQTKTETKDIITDKDGNSSTTSQTASENKTYLKDKDGKNTNSTIDTAKGYDKTIKGEKGETSTKQDELNITNTAQNGTITNDAQNIVNNASGNIKNKANTMDTNVTGKATESYGSLDTTVNGNETHIVKGTKTETVDGKVTENYKAGQATNVTGNQDIHVTGKQTNTVEGGQENIISGGQINNITGDQTTTITGNKKETVTENVTEDYQKDLTTTVGGNEIHEVKGTKTETVEGKVTENFKNGQETNVTGNQVINVSGTQTTTATDIKRNASSGMIDTIDNDYGTNTETKVAGKTTTDVSIKGTGEEGKYIRGANESRDYLIKGTLKNSETKTVEKTSTEITDGNGKTSATIQDKTQISGSVTNGTSSAVSNVKADSIDTAVIEGTNTSLISQKKDSITSAVGNGTTSTVIQQGDKDITIASNGGTVGIVGKDIINNATNEITNTAGTKITDKVGNNTRVIDQTSITDTVGTASRKIEDGKITDTAGDSTVTTENGKGTTFAKAGSAAYSTEAGATKDTNIAGNHITTGRVDANELGVSDKDGTKTADLSVKAGEGVKASASDGTTTGSLDVTADEVGSTVKDASGKGSTFKQRIDAIMMESKNVSIKAEERLTNEAKVITNRASEVINNEAININNTATGIIKSKASEIQNQADKLISNKVGENTLENMEDGKITTSIKNGTKQNLTQSDAEKTEHSVVNGSNSTVNKQTSEEITDAVTNGTTTNVTQNTATSSNNTIADKNGNANTVISTADGTSFINSKAAAPVTGASGDGTAVNTTIKGNTITTGKVTMDYADVMKDLGVRGNANITGKTTTGSLEVTGTSTLKGDVTMESNATVKKDLTVEGNTNLKNTKVDGTLDVTQKATFGDSVSIAKDLSVDGNATIKGDVTANSYKVGDKTYIDKNGIHANDQKITNVADGSISEGSKDAVNGGQLYTVKNDLEGKVNKVGANAAAMANLHPMEFDPDSKWNVAAAIGNYGSETAAALGAFYRPNDDVMVNLSTAFGTGENMVGGGVSVRLGKGGNKLSREETNALKAQVADLTARMDALLSVLNPNMSKDFPDVPENHWAYEAVSRLAGNDIVQGYPDGEFHGERTMTRYEMAEIIYNALSRGAEAEKELVEEFKPELQAMAASEKATAERAEG